MNTQPYNQIIAFGIVAVALLVAGYIILPVKQPDYHVGTNAALAIQFEHLSGQATNSCGGGKAVVNTLPESGRLQGSCCGPMNMHNYEKQTKGLKKYDSYDIIPKDPYDVPVTWAREMIEYGEQTILSFEQQTIYDEAVELSHEGGPCCCVCWHWYAYEGLAKHLIINDGFVAEQIAEVWDLSDACGGEDHH